MDGPATLADTEFRTPARILIPKLLKSREGWKTKCLRRRAQIKTLNIKVRDLTASRGAWRAKYETLLAQHEQLQLEHTQLQHQFQTVEAERDDAKKK